MAGTAELLRCTFRQISATTCVARSGGCAAQPCRAACPQARCLTIQSTVHAPRRAGSLTERRRAAKNKWSVCCRRICPESWLQSTALQPVAYGGTRKRSNFFTRSIDPISTVNRDCTGIAGATLTGPIDNNNTHVRNSKKCPKPSRFIQTPQGRGLPRKRRRPPSW